MQASAIASQVKQTIAAFSLIKREPTVLRVPQYAGAHVLVRGPQILAMIEKGHTRHQIAAELGIGEASVHSYATQYRRAKREGYA